MAVCWVIAGRQRGVGKTHLARRLCEVLPRATHAKLGHSPRQNGKTANYFRRDCDLSAFVAACQETYAHLLVEANAWARSGRGDLVVCLEPGEQSPLVGGANPAAPITHAQICLGGAAGPAQWEPALRPWLPERPLRRLVLAVLQEQHRFLRAPQPQVRSSLSLVVGDRHLLGHGLVQLLDEIEHYGSIRAAARVCGMNYRGAWELLKGAEQKLGTALLNPQAGGPYGGGSSLSAAGRRWRDGFPARRREVETFANTRFAKLLTQEAR